MKTVTIKPALLALFFAIAVIVNAQKLPNVQQTSLRTPTNIKVDGKATEWGNKFQAYNKTTGIYYTIANDDDKLYLTVQATDPDILRKIALGGITFTISPSNKKKDKNGVAITFPAYDKKDPPFFLILNNKPKSTTGTVRNTMQSDSFMNVRNIQIANKFKIIQITGVKAIADSIISIYNAEGIKATALFDNKMYYTYKLAMPIKYIGLSLNTPIKFSYQIMLNGAATNNAIIMISPSGRFIVVMDAQHNPRVAYPATPQGTTIVYPTDFWGEYTLAKK